MNSSLTTAFWRVWPCIGIALLVGCNGPKKNPASAKIISTRIVPWTSMYGKTDPMIYVDWQNTGPTPIRAVRANLKVFDATNKVVFDKPGATIYVKPDVDPGIAPGATFKEPEGEGYIPALPPGAKKPLRATAELMIVEEFLRTPEKIEMPLPPHRVRR